MPSPRQAEFDNVLIRRMAASDFARIAPDLKRFEMRLGDRLFLPGEPAGHALFPESGIVSMVAVSPEGQRVEAGLFGRDGFGPSVLATGDDRSPFEGDIQLPGWGCRIATEPFRAALEESMALRALLQRFAHCLAAQAAYTALSNAVHPMDERLARWLLMVDDRTDVGELPLTHEFMSVMLAVRRPSVTTALHVLEGNGFIRATRGVVAIRNREGLEEFAGDAYGAPEREYARLLGPMR